MKLPLILFLRRVGFGPAIAFLLTHAAPALCAQTTGALYVGTLAGNPAGQAFNTAADGLGPAARFSLPFGVAVTREGDLYVCDSYNFRICRITPRGEVTTVAGFGAPSAASTGATVFGNPEGLAVDDSTGDVYIADAFSNTIRKMTAAGIVTTLAGQPGTSGSADGTGPAARFNFPRGVAVAGAYVYVTDSLNRTIRRIEKTTGVVITLAGSAGSLGAVDGNGAAARFLQPWGIAMDPTGGSTIVVTDYTGHTIRRVTLTGVVTTIAGAAGLSGNADGAAMAARFFQPGGVAADAAGNLYVADTFNHTLRKITSAGVVSTIAGSAGQSGLVDGTGNVARFSGPYGVAVDAAGRIYVADTNNAVIRVVVAPAPPVVAGAVGDLTVERATNVDLGGVTFTTSVYPTFQWFKDGQPIAGATNPKLHFDSAQAPDSGAYFVRLTNPFGTATSNTFTFTVRAPPVIASLTEPLTLTGNFSAVLRVAGLGAGPISYQWFRGGVPLAGETSSALITDVPGAYGVELTNPFGRTTSNVVQIRPAKRLVNLATLGSVRAGGETLVAGFAVNADDTRSKQFLIRGIGPALAAFGVSAAVARPGLTLYRGTTAIATNNAWSTSADATQIAAVARTVGAFALNASGADSALLVTLAPGNYTAEVAGTNGTSGVALVEIYEVAAELNRLVNLSTRGTVSETESLTAGVVVSGTTSAQLLVRAIGPGLAAFGVNGAVARPQLRIFSGGALVASNAGWSTAPATGPLLDATVATGAFALASGSADSALLLTLAPGNYTAEVTAIGGGGTALVEVYEVP